MYSQKTVLFCFVFNKGANIPKWRKDSPFNRQCWDNGTFIGKTVNLNPHIKINSKQIVNLNVQPKIIKFLEGNRGKNICELWLGKDLLHRKQKLKL